MSDLEETERRRREFERDMVLLVEVLTPIAIVFFLFLLIEHFGLFQR